MNETHDGDRDFWQITVLRCTVSAHNERTGEIREVFFGSNADGPRGYPSISAALRAIGRTIDNDRS